MVMLCFTSFKAGSKTWAGIGVGNRASKWSCNKSNKSIEAGMRRRVPNKSNVGGVLPDDDDDDDDDCDRRGGMNCCSVSTRMSKCEGAPGLCW